MDQLTIGYMGFLVFVALIFLRVPIAYGMGIVGTAGLFYVYGPKVVFTIAISQKYKNSSSSELFILMAEFQNFEKTLDFFWGEV